MVLLMQARRLVSYRRLGRRMRPSLRATLRAPPAIGPRSVVQCPRCRSLARWASISRRPQGRFSSRSREGLTSYAAISDGTDATAVAESTNARDAGRDGGLRPVADERVREDHRDRSAVLRRSP